jgi:hypothetical protein
MRRRCRCAETSSVRQTSPVRSVVDAAKHRRCAEASFVREHIVSARIDGQRANASSMRGRVVVRER